MTEVPAERVGIAQEAAPHDVNASAPRDALSPAWAWFAALVGPAVLVLAIALEPAPANPNAPATTLESVLGFALLAAFSLAAMAGLRRRPEALTWAAMASALLVTASVLCPVTGHHASVGAWWVVQLGASGAALAACLLGRTKAPQGG